MTVDNFSPLISEIKSERDRLSTLTEELQDLEDAMNGEPTGVELRAAGSILHDYYTGLEKIFRLIALELDGDLPSGEDWHKRLLDRMAGEIEDLRPPVIDGGLKEQLAEYLRFRHLFRHIYGFELKWTRCKPLVQKLPQIHREIAYALDEFENYLREVD
mgnify:FL=1